MNKLSSKSGVILLTAVIGTVFLNKYFLRDKLFFYPKPFINLRSYLFTKTEKLRGFVGKIEHFNRLASENDKLRQDNEALLSLKVKIDDLENENDFLRRATRVSQKVGYPIVEAGIFNLNLTPIGYNVLLNKGAEDGISEGDIVVTSENALVGMVQKVMHNFSRVLFISDPEFKITAKVMGSGTATGIGGAPLKAVAGIARGSLSEGMNLDLIVQEEQIKEGETLISSGNDIFPSALVIGFVDHVESRATQIFKKVKIRPAINDTQLGKVLVIKMSR